MYTYGNRLATGAKMDRGVLAAPVFEKLLDVGSRVVDDAKPSDVDGTVLDHFALPTVVHYLITTNTKSLCKVQFILFHRHRETRQ